MALTITSTFLPATSEGGYAAHVEMDGVGLVALADFPAEVVIRLALRGLQEKLRDVGAGQTEEQHIARACLLITEMRAGSYALPGNKVTTKPLTVDEVAYGVVLGMEDSAEIRASWAAMNATERRLAKRDPRFMIAAGEEMIRRAAGS